MKDVKRSVCLCNGEYIGIESIFTVVDGKQINKEEELKKLRILSRGRQLFCACGCGLNVVLVASDNNLVRQHFRLWKGLDASKCQATEESEVSIDSKVVLKCWLDDKLADEELRPRVPVCEVGNGDRKFEYTFYSKKYELAINYCNNRINLLEEKLRALEKTGTKIGIIHIVDQFNEETYGQFPENMKKIQDRQGYCLFLRINERNYSDAELCAAFYAQNLYGLWERIEFAKGKLPEFTILRGGELLLQGNKIKELCKEAVQKHQKAVEKRKLEIEAEKQKRKEMAEQKAFEEEQKKLAEAKRIEEERKITQYCNTRSDDFYTQLLEAINRNDKIFMDEKGRRWCLCVKCGLIHTEERFVIMGEPYGRMRGMCQKCYGKA